MDEYASKVRSWDWFMPPIPPTIALNAANLTITIVRAEYKDVDEKIAIGAIFCHVAIRAHWAHEILDMMLGSHQWVGAAPIFSITLVINIIVIK